MKTLNEVIDFVKKSKSQSHLCICNTNLFDESVNAGVYGFPHSGGKYTKSFWRSVSGLYNIGPNDLVFLYRTNGDVPGCKQIHGPFKIHCVDGHTAIYYDPKSTQFPMTVGIDSDCKARFLFETIIPEIYSIANNFELIKKYETKEIWGYRHPAVMNIGAARKKSITSFTVKQTITILELLRDFGEIRQILSHKLPHQKHLDFFKTLKYKFNDNFIMSADVNDEAVLYSYLLQGLCNPLSAIRSTLVSDFEQINKGILNGTFASISENSMLEIIVSPHLQDEMDILLQNIDDTEMLFIEVKKGEIDELTVLQTVHYIDLLQCIFPTRKVYANIIGSHISTGVVPQAFENRMKLVVYNKTPNGIRFS